jgi:hypothetical protein
MNQPRQIFVTTPQGKMRLCAGAFLLGLPALFVSSWLLDPSQWEWHVAGIERLVCEILILLMLALAVGAGVHITLFRTIVALDRACGSISREISVWGVTVHRRVWRMSDFQRIELRHHAFGEGPGDAYQTDVRLRHSSGHVIWLRAFLSPPEAPSPEAVAFAGNLGENMGLALEIKKA